MQSWQVLPRASLQRAGDMSRRFAVLGIHTSHDAGRYVHHLPYGRNTDSRFPGTSSSCGLRERPTPRRDASASRISGRSESAVYCRACPVTPMPLDSPLEAL